MFKGGKGDTRKHSQAVVFPLWCLTSPRKLSDMLFEFHFRRSVRFMMFSENVVFEGVKADL